MSLPSTVAIVPARGGSKGLPRKNVIEFCGYPLLAWTVACARRCPLIDIVYVSTDDEEIACVARRYGAEVIVRPAELAGDTASSETALIHACETIRRRAGLPEAIVFLQATSPLREADELSGALRKFSGEADDSMFAAAQPDDMLLWLEGDDGLQSLNFDYRSRMRRQDAQHGPDIWIETGSFYITRTDLLLASGNRLGGRIGIWPVPSWKALEIDSWEGLQICAAMMRRHGLDVPPPEAITREGGGSRERG